MAYANGKVLENFGSFWRMRDFRVELNAKPGFIFVYKASERGVLSGSNGQEAVGALL